MDTSRSRCAPSLEVPRRFSIVYSILSWSEVSQPAIGFSRKSKRLWRPRASTSYVQRATCASFITPSLRFTNRASLYSNKAVSDGAISFYLDHFVTTRVSKVAYGSFCHIPYDATDPEHRQRESTTFMSVSNAKRIGSYFQVVLPKVWLHLKTVHKGRPLTDLCRILKCRKRRSSATTFGTSLNPRKA